MFEQFSLLESKQELLESEQDKSSLWRVETTTFRCVITRKLLSHRLFHKQLNLENILVLEENCRSTVVFCSNGKWVSRKHSTTRQKTFGELVFELFVRAVEVGSSSERLSV